MPTLSVVAEHIQHLRRRGLRDTTIDKQRRAIGKLARWLEGEDTDLLEATPEQLMRFCDLVSGVGGRRNRVNHVSGFYRWAHEVADLIDKNPTRRLIRPRPPAPNPRPIAEERLARAIAAADDPVRSWFLLAAFCGLRAMEIAPLQSDDVRLVSGTLLVREGKGGKPRTVPLPPIVAADLEPKLGGRWLWPSPYRSGPITANQLQRRANRALRALGIPDTLHALRHRYGTEMYRISGFDLRLTQEVMGHSSPSTTARYIAIDARRARRVRRHCRCPSRR